jgi:1,4-dihydroxy-6-naphthoate synthase
MDEDVMYKHIELYVNDFTKNLGEIGKNSISKLLQKAVDLGFVNSIPNNIFA